MKIQATSQPVCRTTNFKGNDVNRATKIVQKEAEKVIDGTLPKLRTKLNNVLFKNDGEAQTQIINGIFTATLAPLMIKNNPFSKKDPKQKEYSAIRQPISAAIAVTGGLGMTKAVNRWMDVMCNTGAIESIDGRMKPTDAFLNTEFKKEFKKAKKANQLDDFFKKYADDAVKDGMTGSELKKAALESYKEAIRTERKELFTTLMSEAPENIKFEKGIISVNGKVIGENIPNLATRDQFEDFIKKNNLHNISFEEFMSKNFNIKKYKDGALKGTLTPSAEKEIEKLNITDLFKKTGLVGKETFADGVEKIDDAALKDLYKKISKSKSEEYISELMKSSAADAMKKISEGVNKVKGTNKILKSNIQFDDMVQNMFKSATDALGTNFKNYKKYTGIIFNLPMTVITCTVLNWVYPRFVEKFRPDLLPKPKETKAAQVSKEGGNK